MFINEYRSEHSVEMMCRVLDVSRSGYYAWAKRDVGPREHANRELLEHIRLFHRQSRETYGSSRVVRDLHAMGIRCGKNRVARLMRRHGIVAKTRRRFKVTTRVRKGAQYAPDRLGRRFVAELPNPGMDIGYHLHLDAGRMAVLGGRAGSVLAIDRWLGDQCVR